MLEPQSTALFVLLMVVFGLLAWWMTRARQPVLRLLAGCLTFLPAVMFGVVAVNKYYGYYQTWQAAIADFTNQGPPGSPAGTVSSRNHLSQLTKSDLQLARQQGYTEVFTVTGKLSRITRTAYVYLPPQYFQPAYQKYRFPVVELIHGQPGEPQDWINVMGVTATFDQLLAERRASPAVLVMPDANGGENISLQCLNQADGPQDLTYLARDVPDVISRHLRVQPPGRAWGVAGYSEGGFCAANMALRFPHRYGFAGVMSGYFKPADNQLQNPFRRVSPFGGNRRLAAENTPARALRALRPGTRIPAFWLGAGTANRQDVANAETFWQELLLRQADAPLVLTRGEGHNMGTWRREVPAMLAWMTPRLAQAAALEARAGHRPSAQSSAAPRHRAARKRRASPTAPPTRRSPVVANAPSAGPTRSAPVPGLPKF